MEIVHDNVEAPKELEATEPKISREQRRQMDRLNKEAGETFTALANSYHKFFMENDPESDTVLQKRRELNAKWRMYCKNRNLIKEAYGQISDFCDNLYAQYQSEINPPSDDTLPQGVR